MNRSKGLLVALSAVLGALAGPVLAGEPRLAPVLPDALRWFSPPGVDALQAAWVLGSEQIAGPYVLRVRLEAGGRIPPHTHPDERATTVLSGTIHVGLGDSFDEAALVAVPEGGVYVIPARAPHFLWAKEGAVLYQESGTGPTATTPTGPRGEERRE